MKQIITELSKLKSVRAPQELQDRIAMLSETLIPQRPRLPILLNFRWAFAVLLLILVSSSSLIVASERSLPSSPLYPIKKAIEDIRIEFTANPASRVELHSQNADRRAQELVQSVSEDPETIQNVSNEYEQEVSSAIEEIEKIDDEKTRVAQNINEHLETHSEVLQRVATQIAQPAQPAIQHAIEVSTNAKTRVNAILSTTPSQPPLTPTPRQSHPPGGESPTKTTFESIQEPSDH